MNSDHKTVARKHIKSAMAYEVHDGRDTSFFRYNYDRKGRLISIDQFRWTEHFYTERFDERGYQTESLRLHPVSFTDAMLPYKEYVRLHGSNFRYDTAFYWKSAYDEKGKSVFMLTIDKESSQRIATHWWTRGDTTYSYHSLGNSGLEPDGIEIQHKVDSIKNGYAMVYYLIDDGDTTFDYCVVSVLNHNGDPIREYYTYKPDSVDHLNQAGQYYNPLLDTGVKLQLFHSYQYEYSRSGALKQTTITNHRTNETKMIPVLGSGAEGFKSLEVIKDFGIVVYEYYE